MGENFFEQRLQGRVFVFIIFNRRLQKIEQSGSNEAF